MGEWDPATRVGWAAHHAALFVTARHDIVDLASVAPILSGHDLSTARVPQRSFVDAYMSVAKEGGFVVNDSMLAELRSVEAQLDPAVRDAAAILLSGAAESARLQRLAFSRLTPEQRAFLQYETAGLDALYGAPSMSDADLARLERATQLAARVDQEKLAQSAVVAVMATAQAKTILEGRDAFQTQSAATKVATGLRGLLARFLPVGAAQAQSPPGCQPFLVAAANCVDQDILLRLTYPMSGFPFQGMTPAEHRAYTQLASQGRPWTCDERECVWYGRGMGEANIDILVITGTQSKTYTPDKTMRFVCNAVARDGRYEPGMNCRFEEASRYGSANIHVDLGGSDIYDMPVAVVGVNATLPVAIHLDLEGSDRYLDPTSQYDGLSPQVRDLGFLAGHPTQASALYGGVALLVDALGSDSYEAPTRSQGYARFGFALLADLGGENDIYVGREWVQGASSETFSLGSAILFDRSGNDDYTAALGQGYGLGAVLLDVGGEDTYTNADAPFGVPVVRLQVLPGGDVTTLDERNNGRVWADGPGSISIGLGIDQELAGTSGSDSDDYADIIEFLLGTDPEDPDDNPQTNPFARVRAILLDADGDGYPDYIERAFSTDPENGASYPAGFPQRVVVRIPTEVTNAIPEQQREFLGIQEGGIDLVGGGSETTGANMTSSDKIIDLRLPLQDAGTIDYACSGQFYPNATAPMGLAPGENILLPVFHRIGWTDINETASGGGPVVREDGSPYQRCVMVSYATDSPGSGNGTLPRNTTTGDQYRFRFPAGILAVGDVVDTKYVADYFVVIDLGGGDRFENSAGGALLVQTEPHGEYANAADGNRVNNTFLAPSLVINVDPRELTDVVDAGSSSNDQYVNDTRDFAHGAYFGLLVDSGGSDLYVARDASQGALGGVLVDLDGADKYVAGHLSQGASLAATAAGSMPAGNNQPPARPVGDLPHGGALPSESVQGSTQVGIHRRSVPGILLDAGEAPAVGNGPKQFFDARSHSQGFARGYPSNDINQNLIRRAPAAYGILASLGNVAEQFNASGRFAQGVAGVDGVGILFNADGFDSYRAESLVSQGATISQTVYTNDPRPNVAPHPALGILVDLNGFDVYTASDPVSRTGGPRTMERQERTTIQRAESYSERSESVMLYTDVGIHVDASSAAPLNGLMGTGTSGQGAVGQGLDASEREPFHVYMPTARLAIGKNGSTTYDREFAFVVDLGGNNQYNFSSAGLIRDAIAATPASGALEAAGAATSRYRGEVGLFPVTLVVDAGRGSSNYTTNRTFAQGAGLFGIGVLVDLGGKDTLLSRPTAGLAYGSSWVSPTADGVGFAQPIIDATIGSDWDGIPVIDMEMRSMNDTRFTKSGWKLRVANDDKSLYIGIEGRTSSDTETLRRMDRLNVTIDVGREHRAWHEGIERTGIDRVQVSFDQNTGACIARDWGWDNATKGYILDPLQSTSMRVACRYTSDGDVYYEIRKDLLVGAVYDPHDAAYCYDETVGFGRSLDAANRTCAFPSNEFGLYVEFGDAGAGYYAAQGNSAVPSLFAWPPNAADNDGENNNERTGTLEDEMRRWAAFRLAQLEKDALPPTNILSPSLAQGVGIAGVGIVAMLGTSGGDTRMLAGDMSQGFGAYGGVGIVLDTAGSDTYEGGAQTLGAATTRGFALFLDTDGNDNYRPRKDSLGWTTANPLSYGHAFFLDGAGDDEYAWLPSEATMQVDAMRNPPPSETNAQLAQRGNNLVWSQGSPSEGAPGPGIGVDFRIMDAWRQTVVASSLRPLYGENRTALLITEYEGGDTGPWKNGCTDRLVTAESGVGSGAVPDFRVSGTVCFVAAVELWEGNAYTNARAVGNAVNNQAVKDLLTSNTQNMTVGGRLNVSSVEFFIDRVRVASTQSKVAINHTASRWAAPVDLSNFSDGVARAKALPLFVATLDQGFGVYLMHDDVSNSFDETMTRAVRTLLIDNPPRPKVGLEPAFTGAANATYSKHAVGTQQNLYVNYSVDRDVGEDGYAQANGWRPHRNFTHLPCEGVPPSDAQGVRLCNILPFYLGARGDTLTTNPGTDPAPRTFVTESFDGEVFSAMTHDLERPLTIYGKESFKLTIPSRVSLLPNSNYTTEVQVRVYNGNQYVRLGGDPWKLGYAREEAPKAVPSPDEADDVARVLGPIFGSAQQRFNTVLDTAEQQAQNLRGNALRTQTNAIFTTLCSTDSPQCRIVTGNPIASGAFEVCRSEAPGNFPLRPVLGGPVWTARMAVDSLGQSAAQRNVICQPYYNDVNLTADTVGPIPAAITTAVSDAALTILDGVNDALDDTGLQNLEEDRERVDGIKFNHIWFDVNNSFDTSALTNACNANGCIRVDGDGNVVLPRGMRLALEFGLVTGSGCPVGLCEAYGGIFRAVNASTIGVLDDANESVTQVDLYNPGCSAAAPSTPACFPSWRNRGDLIHTGVEERLNDEYEGRRIAAAAQTAGVPASIFWVRAGSALDQPRLEIRVPAEPSTAVDVTIDNIATGETVDSLVSNARLVGDLPGTPTRNGGEDNATYWASALERPHVNWTVTKTAPRWSQATAVYSGADLPDGIYHVSVTARDVRDQSTTTRETLLVDSTAPVTIVTTDAFTGKATLEGSSIPVRWSVFESGSGLREVFLYARNGTEGQWYLVGSFPPGVRQHLHSKSAGVMEYSFMTVGVDRAGNVEAAPSSADEPILTLQAARTLAFANKLALGDGVGFRRILVDEGDPRFTSLSLTGGRVVSYQGSDFTFVRAGAPVRFEICALDAETQIGLVNLSLDHVDPVSGSLKSVTFTARDEGPCGESGRLFVNSTWSDVNTDKARFPEGVWTALFQVFDLAGNRIRVPAGNLILDHASPNVTVMPPVLPTGQSAVKPGDVVKIRIIAQDPFGVDEGGIRVDASKFAKNATELRTKAVRVNGVIYQEAQFTVDLPNLQNGVFDVVVTVPDLAGNATVVKSPIAVDFRPFEFVPGTLRVSNVTHNALTLHWRTNEPTSALAKFGTTSVALNGRTPQDMNLSTEHALRVEGLQPHTHYYLRAVAVSAGGFTKESEIIEVDTASALFLEPVSPVSGSSVSGLVAVKFRGGLFNSSDFVSYTLEVRDGANASKPWTFLTTATRQGDTHELTWNSTRFLDGTTYQLRLTAVHGVGAAADRASVVIDRITSDNTPPSVLVLSPLLATNDTTPRLVAEASDALSGLVGQGAQLYLDGERIGELTTEPLQQGRVRLSHSFETPLAQGMRVFELRVPDLAGNVARETWRVAIDGEAPNVTINPTRFAPGTAAAKRDGTVTLNLTMTDLSGVSLAAADTTRLNPRVNETRLVKLVGTDTWQGTVVVTASDASAMIDVPVRVVDLAGNERTVTVPVPLDNVAPQVAATSIVEVRHRLAVIDVPANEPILVNGTATAPGSPPVSAATTSASSTARLAFDGLLPSRTYQYKLTAVDRAGNPVDLAGSFATQQDTVAPSGVGQLSVLDLLNGTLRITWAPATDDVLVSHYRVYRSEDGVTFTVHAETPVPLFEDSGLPYEKPYVYKVAAVDHGANEGEASPSLRAAATAAPQLTAGTVTPTVGTTSTVFRYTVTYLSPGGVTPAYVRIILNGVPQNMTLQSGTASTGAVYVYETRLAPHTRDAPHTYAYEASDGRYTVRLPDAGDVMRGPLVSGDPFADGDLSGLAAFAQRVPLGGVAGVALAMIAAVGLAALLRRKKEGSQ
ncbi:MAG TPA: fibronectin type III domain-containing protein [Candidatus Thermoplasmatota archaeon]|nr:fibronectin type III domain-containing protein [Candidatus Thermoplasmatota archaeon]